MTTDEAQATQGPEAIDLQPGQLFDYRYLVERLLGEGDRKRTYLAKDTKLQDRRVALSVVKPEAAVLDPDGTRREVEILVRVGSHPNIVSLHEMGVEGTSQYMVFDYLSGGTLEDLIARTTGKSDGVSAAQILRYGRQLCRGLSHLHRCGVIHRDVSPSNIWLDQREEAHLGDLDSAIQVGATDGLPPLTTEAFASPEELRGEPLDQRSDLFSLGCVLLTLATGSAVKNPQAVRGRTDLPSSFADLVDSLLAESPDARPDDADGVLRWLDDVRKASDIEAVIAAGEGPQVEFKSSLRHPYGPLPPQWEKLPPAERLASVLKELARSVTKSIAAFLNTEGGLLLIGVGDDRTVLGIEADFATLSLGKQNADGWLLALKRVIFKELDAGVWSAIRISLVHHHQGTVAVISCPRRSVETWLQEPEEFYIRTTSSSDPLSPSRAVSWIRQHWPG